MRMTKCSIHSCLVLFTCYLVMFLNTGFFYSVGTIFVDVMSTFNISRAETAVFHSTGMGVVFGTGLISGVFIQRFGIILCGIVGGCLASIGIMTCFFATSIVHMTISFGIVYAIGLCSLYICSATAIGQHFAGDRKLLFLSLQASGAATGGMVYPYILAYLSELYGFRGALLIVGGMTMNCIPGCLLWKHQRKNETNLRRDNTNGERLRQYQESYHTNVIRNKDKVIIEKSNHATNCNEPDIYFIDNFPVLSNDPQTRKIVVKQRDLAGNDHAETERTVLQSVKYVVKNRGFMTFVLGCVTAYPSVGIVVIFVADVFKDKGLTLDDTTFGLLLMNILNIIGRLMPGAMMQSKHIPTLFCPLLASLMATIVLVAFSLPTSRSETIAILAFTGIPLGMVISMFSVISTKIIGTKDLPTAIGVLFSANGIGNAIAGPVSGYIRDLSGSYTVPFYAAAGMITFASLLFLITWATQKMKRYQRRHCSTVFDLTSM